MAGKDNAAAPNDPFWTVVRSYGPAPNISNGSYQKPPYIPAVEHENHLIGRSLISSMSASTVLFEHLPNRVLVA